jgi:hypothetical protein
MPLGSQNPSRPDLNLKKPARYTLLEMLHTTSKDEEKFLFLVEIFHIENFIKKVDLDDLYAMLS